MGEFDRARERTRVDVASAMRKSAREIDRSIDAILDTFGERAPLTDTMRHAAWLLDEGARHLEYAVSDLRSARRIHEAPTSPHEQEVANG